MGDYGKLFELEQRRRQPEPPTPSSQPEKLTRDVVTSRRHDVVSPPLAKGFDINRETASHDTLRLSVDETRALEEVKASLKWDHAVAVSKNDICRVALHTLIEEYRAHGANSVALKRLRLKLGRQ